MANINSITTNSSSSTTNLYGTRNVLTGLASGMDTEALIQNSISGYQAKLTSLRQQQTKIEWKQDAYRTLTDQMYNIMQKYTSYTSKTNLSSNAFFTNATTTTAQGENASAVYATGKSTSEVLINSVTQLATSARYSVAASKLSYADNAVNMSGDAVTTESMKKISTIAGSLSLNLGSDKFTLDFAESEVYETGEDLVAAINQKLQDQNAEIKATLTDGKINFTSTSTKGDSVFLSGATGNFKSKFGVQYASSSAAEDRFTYTSIDLGEEVLNRDTTMASYLSNKTVEVTLNGVTKSISVGRLDESEGPLSEQIRNNLQANLDSAFGAGAVTVSESDGKLSFGVQEGVGSTLLVKSDTEELGLKAGVANYFDTSKTLGGLLGESAFEGDEKKDFVINGVNVGSFGKDASLNDVLEAINSSSSAGVSVSFSKLTGEFVFNAKETGSAQSISFGDGLAADLFSSPEGKTTAGQDAILNVSVNGTELSLTRASNTIDMDGMSVTLKKTFTEGEAVSFKTTSDVDKIVDTIKSFVEDINKVMQDVHDAYATMPAEKNSKKHTRYEPLTDDDKKDMSESAIKAYEEKAKQGLLFGDSDLSSLYEKLRSTIDASGKTRNDMKEIGISAAYSNGVTTIALDESALRAALESDPDKVRKVFATTQDSDGKTSGMMESFRSTLNTYASTSYGSQGILVKKAGTKLSPLSLLSNSLQTQLDNLNTQIDNWETKISSKIDYYTKQFTAMEKMINTMNSQSSMLADLSGGY
ncbi:MAG: flagellar hook protein [Ruminococcaceae bacterium]|jgi:flagellar hook-associated protein 2|nr:flagellar hook protein [Oscillospiraceae bacterium]